MNRIQTAEFPELCKQYTFQDGVLDEFPNATAARVAFARVMRERGYRRGPGRVWLKAGMAAVMEP